jgi:hypothetical protein
MWHEHEHEHPGVFHTHTHEAAPGTDAGGSAGGVRGLTSA